MKAVQIMIPFTPVELSAIFLVTCLGATVQGAVGYGMALIAAPILLLIDSDFIPGPMTVAATLLVVLVVLRDKQALDIFGLKWSIFGMIFGLGLGAYVLSNFSGRSFTTIFGALIVLAVGMSILGLRFPPRKPILIGAGFLAGLMGILTTTSGPPIALVYQDAPGKKLRATISGFFVIGIVFTVLTLVSIGKLGMREINLSMFLIPGILTGYWLSSKIVKWVDRGFTRPAVLAVAALSAFAILISQIK